MTADDSVGHLGADEAPFIPHSADEEAIPPEPWRVFGSKAYFRLWIAQVFSSLGDWIGLLAILAIANRVSDGNAAALSLVMVARMLPGFILAPVCGALVDRWDRKRVMIVTDVSRAAIIALLPFVDSIMALVVASFALELLTLFWAPAKDASVPHLVRRESLTQANSLSLVASFGTFPLGALVFALLAGLAEWLGGFEFLSFFDADQEALALFLDALTYLASGVIIISLPIPQRARLADKRADWVQTWRDIKEGVRFIATHDLVRGVMIGLGGGLIGGGMMIPLGPVFSTEVLLEGTSGFGLLMFSLGFGASVGVVALLWLQRRLPRETVFWVSTMTVGIGIFIGASFSALPAVMLVVVVVGAAAGAGYVTGFTLLQEHAHDEVRGRTFAALYTIIRVCLLLALTVSPLFAGLFDQISEAAFDDSAFEVSGQTMHLPGVRLALWLGGLIAFAAGWAARRDIIRALRRQAQAREEMAAEHPGEERSVRAVGGADD